MADITPVLPKPTPEGEDYRVWIGFGMNIIITMICLLYAGYYIGTHWFQDYVIVLNFIYK